MAGSTPFSCLPNIQTHPYYAMTCMPARFLRTLFKLMDCSSWSKKTNKKTNKNKTSERLFVHQVFAKYFKPVKTANSFSLCLRVQHTLHQHHQGASSEKLPINFTILGPWPASVSDYQLIAQSGVPFRHPCYLRNGRSFVFWKRKKHCSLIAGHPPNSV